MSICNENANEMMIVRVEKRALCRTNRKETIGNVKIRTL